MIDFNKVALIGNQCSDVRMGPNQPEYASGFTTNSAGKVINGPMGLITTQTKNVSESECKRIRAAALDNSELMEEVNSSTQSMVDFMLKLDVFKLNKVAEKKDDPFVTAFDFRGVQRVCVGYRVGVDLDRIKFLKICGLTEEDTEKAMELAITYHALIKSGSSDVTTLSNTSSSLQELQKKMVKGYLAFLDYINSNLGMVPISLYCYDLRDKAVSTITKSDDNLVLPSTMCSASFNRDKTPNTRLSIYPMKAAMEKYRVPGDFLIYIDIFFSYSCGMFGGNYKFERDGKVYK